MASTVQPMKGPAVALGIDIGTSGVRIVAIDAGRRIVGNTAQALPPSVTDGVGVEQDPDSWRKAISHALYGLAATTSLTHVAHIAVDGTSGTILPISSTGEALGPGIMYNDARAAIEAKLIAKAAPPASGALGATSALARVLHMQDRGFPSGTWRIVHQADWIAGWLCGRHGVSDENNVLKMGYDPVARRWPDWFGEVSVPRSLLPDVFEPGTILGCLDGDVAAEFNLPPDALVKAGTTDGVASFLATGARLPGEGVTALGSTLVVKFVAERPVFDPASGVYSHRLGDLWLPGGASNVGGHVLARFFSGEDLTRLSTLIDPERSSGLSYYPLAVPGERFPVSDPALVPVLDPRPADDAWFLHGLFEGIARVERMAYDRLTVLGAPELINVRSVGRGAANPIFSRIREQFLRVPMPPVFNMEAAYGAALLALDGVPRRS